MASGDEGDDEVFTFVNPYLELNLGLWFLFAGASIFLHLRLYFKLMRRHGLWWDDYILLACWVILLANNSLIVHEFATGYVLPDSEHEWDNRMRILITISSCGTLINQSLTKTAFAATLLRMSNKWQKGILWFCIVTMNLYMIIKVIFQWAKVCGEEEDYDVSWRIDVCLEDGPRDAMKEGGNVYNIIMDFVFASFPWLLTRSLKISRGEWIGLCVTMSLGMIVAIQSAVRVAWKGDGNDRDRFYIYRNGLSQVWYSSEIAGTIIVQCIPNLRPLVREIQSTRASSKRLDSTSNSRSANRNSRSTNRMSAFIDGAFRPTPALDKENGTQIALEEIPEERVESCASISPYAQSLRMTRNLSRPHTPGAWLHSDSEESGFDQPAAAGAPAAARPPSDGSSVYSSTEAMPARGYSLPRR